MVKSRKDADQKLGEDKIAEIVNKDWKVADLPSEEELKDQEASSTSPKARNNINSRKNLIQYRKDKPKEVKEKIVKNLKFVEVEEDFDPKEIFGSDVDPALFDRLMPAKEICNSRQEQELYYNTVSLFLKDFDMDELTSSDIDDILTLAINQVLVFRLMKGSKANPKLVLEAANAITKFRQNNEKIKSQLANRRVDRVDVKNKPSFSIVHLAASLDEAKHLEYEERVRKLEEEETNYKPYDPLADG